MLLACRSLPLLFKISAIQSDFPLGPSKTRQTGPRPLEHSPRSLLLGRLAVSPQASLSTCWTPGNSPSRMCPSDPRTGRRLCRSSTSAHSHVVLTTWHLLCILLTYVCICECAYVLCSVAQSGLTLCDPLYCSLPGSSVHGDSPGPNTAVGCYAFLQGGLPNPGTELRSGPPHCRRILHHLSHQGVSVCICACLCLHVCG